MTFEKSQKINFLIQLLDKFQQSHNHYTPEEQCFSIHYTKTIIFDFFAKNELFDEKKFHYFKKHNTQFFGLTNFF